MVLFAQYWVDCRWMDPSNPEDLSKMKKRLSIAQALHAPLQRCDLPMLQDVLSTTRMDRDTPSQGPADGGDDHSSGGDSEGSGTHSMRDIFSPAGPSVASGPWPTHPSPAL